MIQGWQFFFPGNGFFFLLICSTVFTSFLVKNFELFL
nr:MAG TPA: hypothetical protein [Caudoviricetes sp.]